MARVPTSDNLRHYRTNAEDNIPGKTMPYLDEVSDKQSSSLQNKH